MKENPGRLSAIAGKRIIARNSRVKVSAERSGICCMALDGPCLYAHQIKVDALVLLGEFLKQMPKRGPQHSKGGGSKDSKRESLPDAPPTLAASNITLKESSTAQRLAALAREKPKVQDGFAPASDKRQ